MTTDEIVFALKSLDLSKYPFDETKGLIKNFGKLAVVEYWLHPGKTIFRGRVNTNADEHFNSRSSLSYVPAHLNINYQRASTPNQTMFYGSTLPENLKQETGLDERLIIAREVSSWVRCDETCGTLLLTYSRWKVTDRIRLVAIVHHKDYHNTNSHTKEVMDNYLKQLVMEPEEVQYHSKRITDFISEQFAKEKTNPDYNYLISAAFSEYICAKGFDGVLYPSVRMDGQGFNVALTPNTVDQKLRLTAASRAKIYKRFKKMTVDNDSIVMIEDDSIDFNYGTMPPGYEANEQMVLNTLGIDDISQICDPL